MEARLAASSDPSIRELAGGLTDGGGLVGWKYLRTHVQAALIQVKTLPPEEAWTRALLIVEVARCGNIFKNATEGLAPNTLRLYERADRRLRETMSRAVPEWGDVITPNNLRTLIKGFQIEDAITQMDDAAELPTPPPRRQPQEGHFSKRTPRSQVGPIRRRKARSRKARPVSILPPIAEECADAKAAPSPSEGTKESELQVLQEVITTNVIEITNTARNTETIIEIPAPPRKYGEALVVTDYRAAGLRRHLDAISAAVGMPTKIYVANDLLGLNTSRDAIRRQLTASPAVKLVLLMGQTGELVRIAAREFGGSFAPQFVVADGLVPRLVAEKTRDLVGEVFVEFGTVVIVIGVPPVDIARHNAILRENEGIWNVPRSPKEVAEQAILNKGLNALTRLQGQDRALITIQHTLAYLNNKSYAGDPSPAFLKGFVYRPCYTTDGMVLSSTGLARLLKDIIISFKFTYKMNRIADFQNLWQSKRTTQHKSS